MDTERIGERVSRGVPDNYIPICSGDPRPKRCTKYTRSKAKDH